MNIQIASCKKKIRLIPALLAIVLVAVLMLPKVGACEEELFLPAKKIFLTPDDDGAARKSPPVRQEAPKASDKAEKKGVTPKKEVAKKITQAKETPKKVAVKPATPKPEPKKTVAQKESVQKTVVKKQDASAPKKVAKAKSTVPAKIVKSLVMEVAGDTLLLHVTTSAPVQKTKYFSTSTGKLVVDISGKWHKAGSNVQRFKEGPVIDLVTGEHPDKFRIVLRWKNPPKKDVVPILQATDKGLSIIIQVPEESRVQ
ncbi:MAG: AMIN domain-containing protein [Desulfovibrio sp.]